jgi:sec-independent protein translocase protein TatB
MDIFGIGFSELVFILIIAMMIFGPRRLPEIAAKMGKFVADMRRMSQGLMAEWQREIAVAGRLEEIEQARKDIQAIKEDLVQAKQELGQAQKDVVAGVKIDPNTIAPPKPAAPKAQPAKTAAGSAAAAPIADKITEPSTPVPTDDKPAEAVQAEPASTLTPKVEQSSPEPVGSAPVEPESVLQQPKSGEAAPGDKKKPKKTAKTPKSGIVETQPSEPAAVVSDAGLPDGQKKPKKTAKAPKPGAVEAQPSEPAAVVSDAASPDGQKKPKKTVKAPKPHAVEAQPSEQAAVVSDAGSPDGQKKPRKTKAAKPAAPAVAQSEPGANETNLSAGKNNNGALPSVSLSEPAALVESKENVNE